MEKFSIDLGNKRAKLVSSVTIKNQETRIFPSYYADSDDVGDDAIVGINNDLKLNKFSLQSDKGFEYVWGQDINKLHIEDQLIDTIGFEDRYSKRSFKLLAEMALGSLAKDFEEAKQTLEVTVSTGVPTNDFNKVDIQKIIEAFKGDHGMTVDDVAINVRVAEVLVLPQPVGTIYTQMLDLDGKVINSDYQSEYVGVVDIGGGTILLDGLKNLALDSLNRKQVFSGAYKLYQNIIKLAQREGVNGLTEYDVETILRFGNDSIGYLYKPSKHETIDITKYVKKARIRFTRDVLNNIEKTFKRTQDMDVLLFTGGGSNLIDKEAIKEAYPFAEFVKNPEVANAYGFYKAANAQ
jgi:plasmid segregation protein ParM